MLGIQGATRQHHRRVLLGLLVAIFLPWPAGPARAGSGSDGSTQLIEALAPPPPVRTVRAIAPPIADADNTPPLSWMVSGALAVGLCVSLGWGFSERRRRTRVVDELSRMKSYIRTVNRNPKMPGPSAPPEA